MNEGGRGSPKADIAALRNSELSFVECVTKGGVRAIMPLFHTMKDLLSGLGDLAMEIKAGLKIPFLIEVRHQLKVELILPLNVFQSK